MQERHLNRDVYFNEQAYTTRQHVMPFIESIKPFKEDLEVLEIGCGEGGNMLPFLDKGYHVTGIDLSSNKIKNAEKFYADHPKINNLTLINEDIYDIDDQKQYDLIIMRDVLEHIHNQEKFMRYVKKFLKTGCAIFLRISALAKSFWWTSTSLR